ncbi:MAG: phosphoribosylamine--glycine ligase [Pseudomonadota bacterium]
MSLEKGARVLVVGSGGREHALAAALQSSPQVAAVAFAGGENAGLEAFAERVDMGEIAARAGEFDLVVVGPEAPLVDGLADRLRAAGIAVFGPSAAAAELEASKAFTKEICAEAGIPTAKSLVCADATVAMAALNTMGAPVVVKADGLAAGKGVVVAETMVEARDAVQHCFDGGFGAAGARVVIEEKLVGPEVSLFALCDGTDVRRFASARDFKRAYDGDAGPNTGGMGAISPAPDVSDELLDQAMEEIVKPAIAALSRRDIDYIGVLYAGLMLTDEGPKLIEFNVRFGDPECQVIMPRLASDPYALLLATATGRLGEADIELRPDTSVAVVIAADGYPADVNRGETINGLDKVAAMADLFHAGTRRVDGAVVSNGGRVLAAVALGADGEAARERVYGALQSLDWPGGRWRSDIGA